MVSLYKRATPAQRQLLRIIEGAVRNALHHHADKPSRNLARSIAKRAVGTLTAYQPEVLAVLRAPSRKATKSTWATRGDSVIVASRTVRGVKDVRSRRKRGLSHPLRQPPLSKIRKELGMLVSMAKENMQTERTATLIEVLRILSES